MVLADNGLPVIKAQRKFISNYYDLENDGDKIIPVHIIPIKQPK